MNALELGAGLSADILAVSLILATAALVFAAATDQKMLKDSKAVAYVVSFVMLVVVWRLLGAP